jgi:transposase
MQVAQDLGISEESLYEWRKDYTAEGRRTNRALAKENEALRRENNELKMELDRLKICPVEK